MGSTTLMTFLVRTPPTTRTVCLLGSWDNFTAPYIMRRDSRIGPEHWSGCHSFSNIICDGHGQSTGGPRQGGLKMGGTYWYYYKLDDEIEFHNSAEPSTTQCPLLPGQLVNVLHVPFTLGGHRQRNASISSTSSEHHTLNPADKFLNPRPVPQPSLPRLKTSPSILQSSWSAYSSPMSAASMTPGSASGTRGGSQPTSATTTRILKIKRSPSLGQTSRSTSPNQQRGRGFKRALQTLTSPRSDSPVADSDRNKVTTEPNLSHLIDLTPTAPAQKLILVDVGSRSSSTSRERTPISARSVGSTSGSVSDLALRRAAGQLRGSNESMSYNSFQGHRRQKTRSREPSPLRNPMMLDIATVSDADDQQYRPPVLLDTVKEISSNQNTPLEPSSAVYRVMDISVDSKQNQLDLEKRLPTLPNTPSSAYPPSIDNSPAKSSLDEIDLLQSHFSCTTIETGSIRSSFEDGDLDYSSKWTSTMDDNPLPSAYTASFIEDEPMSPDRSEEFMNLHISFKDHPTDEEESDGVTTPQAEDFGRPDAVLSNISCTTISVSASNSTTASPVDHHVPLNAWSAPVRSDSLKAPSTWNRFQHYRLPSDDINSQAVPKHYQDRINVPGMTIAQTNQIVVPERRPSPPVIPQISHTTSMRELLDELSYLGNMIRQH